MIDFSYTLAGALTGFVVGMTGVGGGALMTPILLLFFGVAPAAAIATDLWFATFTKLFGIRSYYLRGSVDWQVVRRLWMGSLPVAVLVVVGVGYGLTIDRMDWLQQAIGIVILLTAIGLFFAPVLSNFARHRRITSPERFKSVQPVLTVLSGALLGGLVALTSIGAGALGSVILLYLYPLRMQPHRLVGTDLAHAIPLAAVAGIGYLIAGLVDWWMLASLLLGSLPAVAFGGSLAGRMPARWVRVVLSLVLISVGVKVAFA